MTYNETARAKLNNAKIGIIAKLKSFLSNFSFQSVVQIQISKPSSGQVDRVSATEAVDSGLIPSRVKPKTIRKN